jgi:hypothetical protein
MKIKIYEAEASIAELIVNNSIAYCSKAEKLVVPEGQKIYTSASTKPLDLELFYPTRSILATTIWNKNDDVFSPQHTWAARHTPVHSPTNIDHDHKKIVGHITDSWVINAEGELIADDTEEKDLPSKFHLCNGAVIYKYSREKDLVTRAETLIAEIESGKKFVSMECLFPDFDYAVVSPDNNYYILKREESSAFLTKHLRIYGGKGEYNGNKIGRFLKNMVFSGKGYVDNPANPESIIFDNGTEFNFSSASYKDNWFNVEDKTIIGVDINIKQLSLSEDVTENKIMAEENTVIAKLEAQVASLTKQLVDADVKAKNDEIESLKAQVAKAAAEVETQKAVAEEFKTQVTVAQEEVAKVKAEVAELTTAKTELEAKVEVAVKNETRATRIAKLIDGGVVKEEAEAKVTKFEALSSEQFDAVAEVIISAVKPKTEETVADVEEVVTTEEVDADLTTAETTETVAGSVTDTTDDKAEVSAKRRESIANYLFGTPE